MTFKIQASLGQVFCYCNHKHPMIYLSNWKMCISFINLLTGIKYTQAYIKGNVEIKIESISPNTSIQPWQQLEKMTGHKSPWYSVRNLERVSSCWQSNSDNSKHWTQVSPTSEIILTLQWLQEPSEQRALARRGKGLKFKFILALVFIILNIVPQEDL